MTDEELTQMTRDEMEYDASLDAYEDRERRKCCPTCGRDESCFTTTITSPDGDSWCIECKCGELIDED